MPPLPFPSLLIQNFRALRKLEIPHLGRVNLITGKNNVGKSSLLEAIQAYASAFSPEVVRWVLNGRDEYWARPSARDAGGRDDDLLPYNLRYLFYARPAIDQEIPPIYVGPDGSDRPTIGLQISYFKVVLEEEEEEFGDTTTTRLYVPVKVSDLPQNLDASLYVTTLLGGGMSTRTPLERFFKSPSRQFPIGHTIKSQFVPAQGFGPQDVGLMWDAITLTSLESEVLTSLRLLSPDIERITFVGDALERRGRHALVKFSGGDEPVPLKSLGEGVNRLFGLTLALVNAKDGLLLVDEIESGLHYGVQSQLWRYIFRLAALLNVQVFAITHSYDCVRAFQEAATEHPDDGLLIRLERKGENLGATLFEESELEIAADHDIEVR